MKHLHVYLGDKSLCWKDDEAAVIEYNDLIRMVYNREIFSHIFKYNDVKIFAKRKDDLPMPFLSLCICKYICKRNVKIIDAESQIYSYNVLQIGKLGLHFLYDNLTYKKQIKRISSIVDTLMNKKREGIEYNQDGRPLYLRLDLTSGMIAGGSVGHIAGVVNNFKKYCRPPIFLSTDEIPGVDDKIEKIIVKDKVPYRNVSRVSAFMGNLVTYPTIEKVIREEHIGFIYQRSGLDIYAGVQAAIEHNLPYVLEYNGSEIWCEEKWGSNQLRFVELAKKIERLTFEKADLITCVSKPLKEQLVESGIEARKIIVTPNGVNTDIYNPNINGDRIREKYQIDKFKVVVGFIGTFGAWHGAEILTEAYAKLASQYNNIHLLMIGDGMKMAEVKKIIKKNKLEERATLTGIVPQKEGPEYLGACDILVSPTIKNPDGTPFFGSPTKLFEYMAMGKGIVASDLDQMSEILENEKTALLVEPNNIEAVAEAIVKLIDDKELRLNLGENARREVCDKYTWEMHTKKIVDALKQIST